MADKKIVEEIVGSVKVRFDGTSYIAILLRKNMTGEGYQHWEQFYSNDIAVAKVLCWTQYMKRFGKPNVEAPQEEIKQTEKRRNTKFPKSFFKTYPIK